MVSACCSWVPWEKLTLATSIPARRSCSNISWDWTEGPRVQTILARRIEGRRGWGQMEDRSSTQQLLEVFPLPLERFSIEGKCSFALSENARMVDPAGILHRAGEN